MTLTLVIGNKNYSSWSFRPWIALRQAGIPFDELLLSFDSPEFREQVPKLSGTKRVPVLIDGETRVWESLAILEYVAEKFSDAKLWPADVAARAHARTISSEMHAGFSALRNECPMNFWRPTKTRALSEDARANVARIDELWSDCRARFGKDGPFLFGTFGAADAMYAPVVSRCITYDLPVNDISRAYIAAISGTAAYQEWRAAGVKEPWVYAPDEPDWPVVLRE